MKKQNKQQRPEALVKQAFDCKALFHNAAGDMQGPAHFEVVARSQYDAKRLARITADNLAAEMAGEFEVSSVEVKGGYHA